MTSLALDLDCHDAVFSPDGVYRYELSRTWSDAAPALWLMLNPSTANAVDDDPTVRRCMRFTHGFGVYGGIIVCNLFALRSTDPAALYLAEDPVGPDNDDTILRCARQAGIRIAAWGAHGDHLGRAGAVIRMLRDRQLPLQCLGLTQQGQPRHPLYLPKTATLKAYAG